MDDQGNLTGSVADLLQFVKNWLPEEMLDMREELQEVLVDDRDKFSKIFEDLNEHHSRRHVTAMMKLH